MLIPSRVFSALVEKEESDLWSIREETEFLDASLLVTVDAPPVAGQRCNVSTSG